MKIAVIGSALMDVVSYVDTLPKYGATVHAKGFHIACGGKGANQAVAAGKLGADVLMVSSVGDDFFGVTVRENFIKHNIDIKHVYTIENKGNGVVMIMVEASGQYRSVYYHGANDFMSTEIISKSAEDLKKCGLILLQLEFPIDILNAAIDFANANNIPVILNPAPMNNEFSVETACKCDFVIPNEVELHLLTGMPVSTDDDIRAAAKKLFAKGLKNLIVTMGERGSMWLAEGVEAFVAPFKVDSVDSTGAGDAYIGCFAETYARTGNVLESMQRASKYAALSVTRKGTQDSYLTAEEFERELGARC
ncbi:MAG: ribokinase [Selenomonadaceae bacterium]|nr:ribokinase [Selenomonadaceae bacterium]